MLISQPGSDYQLAAITLDTGQARDITCLLTDIHALLSDLFLDPARPQAAKLAQAILHDRDSLYTPQALISALDEIITTLTPRDKKRAPLTQPAQPRPDQQTRRGQIKEEPALATREGGARSKKNSGAIRD
jgi:hypothetical protein